MAFVKVTEIKNGGGAAASLSVGTPGAGNALLHGGAGFSTGGTITLVCSDGHNTWAQDGTLPPTADLIVCGFASAPNVTAVATTVTVTWASTGFGGFSSFIYEFSAMPTSSIFEAAGTTATGTGTSASTTAQTNTNADAVILGVLTDTGGGAATITSTGSGWNQPAGSTELDGTTSLVAACAYKIVSASASQQETWTKTTANWAARSAVYKANATGVQTPLIPLLPPPVRIQYLR